MKFDMDIKKKLNNNKDCDQIPKLIVKGNFPYKERKPNVPMAPEANDNCIKCCSCIKRCPVDAKSINHESFNKITQFLIDNFSTVRHEPEIFI